MPLMDCDAPASPVPTYTATDLFDRLSFLRLNLWRYNIVSVTGGAVAVDPLTSFGDQHRGWTMPGGSSTPRVQVLGKQAALATATGAAYDLSFEAAVDSGTATLRARWLDAASGAITGISDQAWTITTTPTTFTWDGIASDDPDFAAAPPSNSYFEFFVSSTSDIPSGRTVTITNLQIQSDNYWDQQGIALPWRPAKGEDNLLTYGDYILGLNTDEMAAKPGQQVVVGPEGGGLQLTPSGPTKLQTEGGTTRTLAASDDGSEITFTNASGCTVTLPQNSDAAITTKSQTTLRRATGAGPVVVVAGTGATLAGPPGCIFTITSEEGQATVEKKTTDGWEWSELVGNPINVGGVTVESGSGVPTRMDRAIGSLYMRTDVSQLWRFQFGDPVAVNIVGTDLKSAGGTNVVTLTGFDPTVPVQFSKPLVADSEGLLTWDAYSAWPDDSGTVPVAAPVAGQTWNNAVSLYGNNGGSDVLLFAATIDLNNYTTEALAYAALAAQLPVAAVGYDTYKVQGVADPNPSDNRGGLSILVAIGEWVLMADLAEIQDEGVAVEAAARSMNFTGAGVSVSTDGKGNVTVDIGAGSSGTDLGWFNVKDAAYGALGDGSTDDTAAIQAALDACETAGGGTVYFPRGVYVVNGALQDTSRSNAQLLLPRRDYGDAEAITVVLRGEAPPPAVVSVVGSTPLPDNLSVIKGTLNTGSGALIGAHGPVGTSGDFSNVYVVIRDLTVQMPANPTLAALDLSRVAQLDADNLLIHAGNFDVDTVAAQTTSTSYGLRTPGLNDGALTRLGVVNVVGFYNGFEIGEHCVGQDVTAWACKQAYVFVACYHASHFTRMQAVWCQKGLVFTGGAHYVNIAEYDIEHAASGTWVPTNDVDDASNFAHGSLRWHVVLAGSGIDTTFTVNGASNLSYRAVDKDPTQSALLDAEFGSTQGTMLYRGATAWLALAPGTSGQFLKTLGAAANPAWADVPAAAYLPLVTGAEPPVLVSDGAGHLIGVAYTP